MEGEAMATCRRRLNLALDVGSTSTFRRVSRWTMGHGVSRRKLDAEERESA